VKDTEIKRWQALKLLRWEPFEQREKENYPIWPTTQGSKDIMKFLKCFLGNPDREKNKKMNEMKF
jgi:hypothetical protein